MPHFTYAEPRLDQLRQGDILRKTPKLLDLIKEVHPHYANDDYLYFQVLTQSCDLVRRNGKDCKSRYLTLAAVRSMKLIVQRAIETYSDKFLFEDTLFCSTKHKKPLADLFKKLLNNNDTQHFFLKSYPDVGLNEDCCTQLHLSIAIRAYEHYDICLESKILELREEFRAKLGWLVGNLYSRVGTQDYVPGAIADATEFESFVDDSISQYVVWLPERDYSAYRKGHTNSTSIEELQGRIIADRQRKKDSKVSTLVSAISKALPAGVDEDTKMKLRNLLSAHPLLRTVLDE